MYDITTTEAAYDSTGLAIFGGAWLITTLLITLILIISYWKIFEKAGKPGWAAIIPIYNLVVLFEVAKAPLWLLILVLVPILNFITALPVFVYIAVKLARAFGKDVGFALLLIFVPFIGYPMLAFSDAEYVG